MDTNKQKPARSNNAAIRISDWYKNAAIILMLLLCFTAWPQAVSQSKSAKTPLTDRQIGFNAEKVTQKLKTRGIPETEIAQAVQQFREQQAQLHAEMEERREQEWEQEWEASRPKAPQAATAARTTTALDPDEKAALINFYNQTGGASWTNTVNNVQPWDPSGNTEPDNWYGVTIEDGHVIKLNLFGNNLVTSSTLPDMSAFTHLADLGLSGMGITSTLTPLQVLPSLQSLQLSGCNITGGLLPITTITSLIYLHIYDCQITGTIPPQILNLTNLRNLGLMYNNLSGSMAVLGNMSNLIHLSLGESFDDISIPASFANLSSIRLLYLEGTSLSGNLQVLGGLISLEDLRLYDQNFSGALPSNFGNLINLKSILAEYNNFTDISSIASLPLLRFVSFQVNELTSIPEFSNTNIEHLLFTLNQIQGSIPSYIGNYNQLISLWLSANNLSGNIPSGFAQLSNLSQFTIEYNQLSGKIPPLHVNSVFYLSNNRFRFIDFIDEFNAYKNTLAQFNYGQQAKTDTEYTISNAGGTHNVTLTMFEDGRYVNNHVTFDNDTFQWYKNGIAIPGATNRQYVVSNTATGTYHCEAKHLSNPNMGALTLERHPIHIEAPVPIGRCGISNISIMITGPGEAEVNWEQYGTAPEFIQVSIHPVGNPSQVITVNVSQLFYAFTGLDPDTRYEVYIRTGSHNTGCIIYGGIINFGEDCLQVLQQTGQSRNETLRLINSSTAQTSVKQLLLDLLNDIRLKLIGGQTINESYSSDAFTALKPYLLETDPKIYAFQSVNSNNFSFNFSSKHVAMLPDIRTHGYEFNQPFGDFSTDGFRNWDMQFRGILDLTGKIFIRGINFCEIQCVSHIAIVVDESGSISAGERNKIKKQLTSFLRQQAEENSLRGSNIHISLIGLSDRDENNRTDHKLATNGNKITTDNLGSYLDWVNQYGTRPNVGAGSDFWNSGLKLALDMEMKPDIVLLITDGAQTEMPENLITTMKRFNNYRNPDNPEASLNPDGPHLYVIGMEDGHYIDRDGIAGTPLREEDPNYTEVVTTQKVSRTLTKSLQYLLGYDFPENNFPRRNIRDFGQDYYGHADFLLFVEDEFYLSDNLIRREFICGTESIKDNCEDCNSFKPEPGKEYLLSAWVMEQQNIQVEDYTAPKINLVFYNNKEAQPGDIIPNTTILCEPSGDIIDGWQRIVKKFKIPGDQMTAENPLFLSRPNNPEPQLNAIVMDVELLNTAPGVPVYFDDIRIHPLDGSMKSFVYDPETFKLLSELDENNYATFYEYDNEGGLVRVKKETSRGIKTIQETRSGNVINTNQN